MLESETHGDGKTIHQTPERSAFLMHIDKDFSERPVGIFTGSQVDIVVIYRGFLGVTASSGGQFTARGMRRTRGLRFLRSRLRLAFLIERLEVEDFGRIEGLREFGSVAIDGDGFKPEFPRLIMDVFDIEDGGIAREIDSFGNRTGNHRLNSGHHGDVSHGWDKARSEFTAPIGAIEDGEMFGFEMRCALDGHRPERIEIRLFNLFWRKSDKSEEIEVGILELFLGDFETRSAKFESHDHGRHGEPNIERGLNRFIDGFERGGIESEHAQRFRIDNRCALNRGVP